MKSEKNLLNSFLKTPRLYGSIVSPDLKWVAWVWSNLGPVADVYFAPIDNANSSENSDANEVPKKLTDFKQNTRVMSWTPDSQYVVVYHDYDGDERFRYYKININSGEVTPITEEHPNYFMRGGQITPNGKYLVYGANFDSDTNKEIEQTIIYKQNIETGEKTKLAVPNRPAFVWPELNRQGTYVLYQRDDLSPEGEQIWLVDIDGKEDREILNFGDNVKVSASWHKNSTNIIFTVEAGTYRKVGIFNTVNFSTKWLIDNPSRNIEDAKSIDGTDQIIIIEVRDAKKYISLLDIETLEEKHFSDLQTLTPLAKISDTNWLSKYHNSKQPGDLVIHDSSKVIRHITDVFEKVDYTRDELVRAESYTWKSIDGLQIQGWLYRAKSKSDNPDAKAAGTIVMVHGGPTGHSEDSFDMDIQYFVSEGFNVLDPNYRGSTGFGLEFQESIKVDGWGGKEQDDIVEGVKSLIENGIAEKGKVGITGASYGGYSAWFAITHFPKEYIAASVPICGMADLVVDYDNTRPDLRGYSEEMMGGSPTEVPEKYHKGSPINFVKNIEGKLLIVQGAKDPNVSLENVKAIEEVLIKENIKYEKLIFENEGHGISKPENQKVLLTKSVEFFKEAFN